MHRATLLNRVHAVRNEYGNEPTHGDFLAAVSDVNGRFQRFVRDNDERIERLENDLYARIAGAEVFGVGTRLAPGEVPQLPQAVREDVCGILNGERKTFQNAHTVGTGPGGGFAVVPELERIIAPTVRTLSAMRRIARTVTLPLGVGSWQKLHPAQGASGDWASEVQDRSAETTNAEFARIELTPHEAYVRANMSQWLVADNAVGLEEWLNNDVATAIGEMEGLAFVSGDGVKRPRGITQYDTVANASWTWGKLGYIVTGVSGGFSGGSASPSSSPADQLVDLTFALDAAYRANARWLMSSATAGTLRKVKDQDGRFIWADSLQDGMPPMLLGHPVELDENMPAIGADSLSIAFGDFRRGYTIVDRPGVRLIADPYTTPGIIRSYWFKRTGGGVTDYAAIKFLKFGTS